MTRKSNTQEFINKAKIKHNNKYNYDKVNYINAFAKIIITCNKHGDWEQRPNDHLSGYGCPFCVCGGRIFDTKGFIDKAKTIHGDRFDYSAVEYKGTRIKVLIKCKKHNHEWFQTPNDHLRGAGCPICKLSKGEQAIKMWLIDNNINHVHNHRFNACKNKRPLPFDFWLPEYNCCIEFDGIQHFKLTKLHREAYQFTVTQINDQIKNKFCYDNNINLIRIKYTDLKRISQILTRIFYNNKCGGTK